jgi:hypothetical protein
VAEALKELNDRPHPHYATLRQVLLGWSRTGELPGAGSIGKRLAAIRGRNCGGLALQSDDAGKHTLAWRVVHYSHPTGGDGGNNGHVPT